MTFLLCDPGWYVHEQQPDDKNTHTLLCGTKDVRPVRSTGVVEVQDSTIFCIIDIYFLF